MGVNLLGKIKIHEIAKELGLTSKEIVEKANSLGIKVSSHLSSVEDEDVKRIKEEFGVKSSSKKDDEKKASSSDNKKDDKKKESKKKEDKNASPVIIRREVIVKEEDKKDNEKPKTNQGDIGFVERKKNQDYNIVYRNKTTKPMTFSELFNIKDKKKEEKKVEPVVEPVKKEEKVTKI